VVGEFDDAPGATVVVDETTSPICRSCAALTASSSIDAVATLLHTRTVSMPSRRAVAKVAAARRRLSANTSSATPSRSRSGW
jgi:hypothetical protein